MTIVDKYMLLCYYTYQIMLKGVIKMATTTEYIEYVCEQIKDIGEIRYKKMFGEFMIYVNDKPVIIVCNNVAFVKKLDCIKEMMKDAQIGYPYKGAKEHYVLDIDNSNFCKSIISEIEKVTPIPKPKKKKQIDYFLKQIFEDYSFFYIKL